ncbi:MAG: Na+/H+ antiporter subunit E [Rhodospirillales bacterium]
MRHIISLGLVLAITWGLLSGHSEPLIIGLGVISVILVTYICYRMDVVDHESYSVNLTRHVFTYWPWLIWQILKANIDVTRVILGSSTIQPVMFRVRAAQRSELLQVIFANSITLTPGTITVGHEDGILTIHALTITAHDDAIDKDDGTPSEMNQLCGELEDRVDLRRKAA